MCGVWALRRMRARVCVCVECVCVRLSLNILQLRPLVFQLLNLPAVWCVCGVCVRAFE